jgi:hypothetical protein
VSLRSRFEGAALLLAFAAVAVFLVSAGAGLRLRRAHPGEAPSLQEADEVVVDSAALGARVEVLNGSDRPGLAREATERLRAAGFDVVYFGNAPEPRGLTVVLDRGGRARAAQAVAHALAVPTVRPDPDASRLVDVTVLLGKDWPPPAPPVKRGLGTRVLRMLRSVF